MGQKTHPLGFRLGIVKDWRSRWYADRDFPRMLQEDEKIRTYLERRLAHAALSRVEIEQKPSKIVVTLFTARPGVVIGKRNRGMNSSFTVRKISYGVGVERTFQSFSKLIESISVKRRGDVRQAKLYYLRERSGKAARIKERLNINK